MSVAGISFELPDELVSHTASDGVLHSSREDLKRTFEYGGTTDYVYNRISAAVLNPDDCVVHSGGEEWGTESCFWNDLQARLYRVRLHPDQLVERVRFGAVPAAKQIRECRFPEKVSIDEDPTAPWHMARIEAPLMFQHDVQEETGGKWSCTYGFNATVEFRMKQYGDFTFVFVFMTGAHDKHQEAIAHTLSSFRVRT